MNWLRHHALDVFRVVLTAFIFWKMAVGGWNLGLIQDLAGTAACMAVALIYLGVRIFAPASQSAEFLLVPAHYGAVSALLYLSLAATVTGIWHLRRRNKGIILMSFVVATASLALVMRSVARNPFGIFSTFWEDTLLPLLFFGGMSTALCYLWSPWYKRHLNTA